MATISSTPRPGYAWDATDNCWYPIGTGPHTHSDYITQSTAINPAIVDAKGDIIAATAADSVARLAVGANDTVLTADSSTATGLKWATPAAGGMTLINETVASALSSLSFSSIPSTYKDLYLEWSGIDHSNALTKFEIRFNNDSASNYSARVIEFTDGAVSTTNHLGTVASYWPAFGNAVNNGSTGSAHQVNGRLKISNYASAKKKTYEISYAFYDNQNGRYNGQAWMPNFYNSTSAITSIDIVRTAGAGTFSNQANTSIRLYGIS